MGMFNKVKIVMIGPCDSGKTILSNFLADAMETVGGIYKPTQGVRILEFEVDGVSLGRNESTSVEIVLWDCSGDHKFEICWPSMRRDTNGIIFVYNPDVAGHTKELESWHLHFAKLIGIKDKQCMIMAHQKPSVTAIGKISGIMGRIPLYTCNLEEDPESFMEEFRKFLSNVVSLINDRREKEELSIIE